MMFIRQSPMLISTACRVSLPRLGVRAMAGRTMEVSRDVVKVRLPRLDSEEWLSRLHQGEATVVEIPLPHLRSPHVSRAILCHGNATAVVHPTSLRLEVRVMRLSIRDIRDGARPASAAAPLKMRKGAGR